MTIFGRTSGKLALVPAIGVAVMIVLIFSSFSQHQEPAVPSVAVQHVQLKNALPLTPQKAEDNTALVIRVIDGDTIELEGGQRVRYIGIDAPETVDPRKGVQCFGVEASKRNKQLVEGVRVRLEKDVSETDRYGRLLRYVYVGDRFINLELVQQGFAHSSTYPPDVKRQSQFTKAEAEAHKTKRGLWGTCPIIFS